MINYLFLKGGIGVGTFLPYSSIESGVLFTIYFNGKWGLVSQPVNLVQNSAPLGAWQ
ncbi:hypothetical protein [Salinicola sp. MIT1003]|uniref:hypothetical protein n=1 Tax=Salinicola sp. MIT1003 TaxID=1882734 RepID=UPI00147D6CAC|nr:hypothetical protein [Salinicola sp. MIT1003]